MKTKNAPTHVVMLAFTEGQPLRPGDMVNAVTWPNLELLVRQGYLRVALPVEIKAAVKRGPRLPAPPRTRSTRQAAQQPRAH